MPLQISSLLVIVCGLGCGEVKCPLCIEDANFENNAALRNSCLVAADGGVFKRKR